MNKAKEQLTEVIEPVGLRVLVRKDDDKKVTKGGIQLPDSMEIPTLTGRIVTISAMIENDEEYPIKQYDKVIINPSNAIPVEFESDNKLYIVPAEDVIAVIRKGE